MTTVCAGLGVTTATPLEDRVVIFTGLHHLPETRNKGEIEVENIHQPFHSGCGLVCEDLNELGASLVSGGFQGVFVEGLDAVLDAQVDLSASKGAIDTRSSLGGVATEESYGKLVAIAFSTLFRDNIDRSVIGRDITYLAYLKRGHFHR